MVTIKEYGTHTELKLIVQYDIKIEFYFIWYKFKLCLVLDIAYIREGEL